MKKIIERVVSLWKKNPLGTTVIILLLAFAFTLGKASTPKQLTPPVSSPTLSAVSTPTIEQKEQESETKLEEKSEVQITKSKIDYRGIVSRVIDGDTIELEGGERIRYLGINAPEKGRPFSTEATEANKKLVDAKEVELELDVQSKDQYERTLAYVWIEETMINRELVRQGFANVYTLPPNVKYKDEFLAAEQEAREAEKGLWNKGEALGTEETKIGVVNINADAPGNDNDNKNGEWVEIKNTGNSTVNMGGWSLKDEANHIYTFADFSLAPNASAFIYSGAGTNTQTELYWDNPKTAIWNNTGDTAFLRDASGNLVDSYKY